MRDRGQSPIRCLDVEHGDQRAVVTIPSVGPFVGDAPEDRHAERVVRRDADLSLNGNICRAPYWSRSAKGGEAPAAKMSPERRSEIARTATKRRRG
jgi:hypothetical protein